MWCFSNLLLGAFFVASTFVWAEAPAGDIRLIFGDMNTLRDSGDVVVTSDGDALGEEVFPAISDDHSEIAILYGSHEYVIGLGVDIIDAVKHTSIERFTINYPFVEETPELQAAKIRERLEIVNAYLADRDFTTMPGFYDFSHNRLNEYREGYAGKELSEYWEAESGPWRIVYWKAEEILEIFARDAGGVDESVLILRPPLTIYGIGPGWLCGIRSMPLKGWYDEDVDALVLRLDYSWGVHDACDRPDRWYVERLRKS